MVLDEGSTAFLHFLSTTSHAYGYGADSQAPAPSTTHVPTTTCKLDRIRHTEFSRLSRGGEYSTTNDDACGQQQPIAYLDHAGSALYSEKQLERVFEELRAVLLSNPHSLGSSSTSAALEAEDSLRRLTLELCNASGREYEVVLTSGATASLRLVAEAFPWMPGCSHFAYMDQNHNSVLGMREMAMAAGADAYAVQLQQDAKKSVCDHHVAQQCEAAKKGLCGHLLAQHSEAARGNSSGLPRPCCEGLQGGGGVAAAGSVAARKDVGDACEQQQGAQPGLSQDHGPAQVRHARERPTRLVACSPRMWRQRQAVGVQGTQVQLQQKHVTKVTLPEQDKQLKGGMPVEQQQQQQQQQQALPQQNGAIAGSASQPSLALPNTGPPDGCVYHLFAMPHECNFSGRRFDLGLVQQVQNQGVGTGLSTHMPEAALSHTSLIDDGQQQVQNQRTGTELCTCVPEPSSNHTGLIVDGQQQQQQQQHYELGNSAQEHRWLVLLDAAKSCATSPPDLSRYPADFVAMSYYKVFGFPTGLGALIVRKPAAELLRRHKQYFGGGTVGVSIADQDFFSRRPGPAGLEDGTLPFTSIAAAHHGFAFLCCLGAREDINSSLNSTFSKGSIDVHTHSISPHHPNYNPNTCNKSSSIHAHIHPDLPLTHPRHGDLRSKASTGVLADAMAAIAAHCSCLTGWLVQQLRGLRHSNGRPLVEVYGHDYVAAAPGAEDAGAGDGGIGEMGGEELGGSAGWGPVVSFNLLRADGSRVGCNEVGRLAALHGIILRTGCFCNPGACAKYLGLSGDEMRENFEGGHVCWDDKDIVRGKPTGAVRISLGHVTTFHDVYTAVSFLRHYFVEGGRPGQGVPCSPNGNTTEPLMLVAPQPSAPKGPSQNNCTSNAAASEQTPSHTPHLLHSPHPTALTVGGQPSNTGSSGTPANFTLYPPSSTPAPPPSSSSPSAAAAAVAAKGAASARLPASSQTPASSPGGAITMAPSTCPCPPHQPAPLGAQPALQHPPAETIPQLQHPPAQPVSQLQHPLAQASTTSSPPPTCCANHAASCGVLQAIYLYPIKSCAPQQVEWWPLGPTGLLYDREWALLGDNGSVVTQKHCPRMALVQPRVDLERRTLTITAPGMLTTLIVGIGTLQAEQQQQQQQWPKGPAQQGPEEVIQVCGDRVCGTLVGVQVVASSSSSNSCSGSASKGGDHEGSDCNGAHKRSEGGGGASSGAGAVNGEEMVRAWFAEAVGVPCRLVQQAAGAREARAGTAGLGPKKKTGPAGADKEAEQQQQQQLQQQQGQQQGPTIGSRPPGRAQLGFANDGQFLLVNEASVRDVNERIASGDAGSREGRSGFMPAKKGSPVELLRFRPNFVVGGFPAYEEDHWARVQIGTCSCSVLGTCPRCEMLQVDQSTGTRGKPEVLLALAQYRRHNGRMHFGILLTADGDDQGSGLLAGCSPVQRCTAEGSANLAGFSGLSTAGTGQRRGGGGGDEQVTVPGGLPCKWFRVGDSVCAQRIS